MTDHRFFVTTSWDDGHPLDFRIAELLQKYDLKGTFYIPRHAERDTMSERDIHHLSSAFEIGAHTLHHTVLTNVDHATGAREIVDSKSWVEETVGKHCPMFCFPQGKFARRHLDIVRDAGFIAARTVEFLSTSFPHETHGTLQMPTTIQAQPHPNATYLRNLAKRRAVGKLSQYIRHFRSRSWTTIADHIWQGSESGSGVFHLWGHSWEIDEFDQWRPLEDMLRFLSEHTEPDQRKTNAEICAMVT